MTNLLIATLSSYSVTVIVTSSSLFEPARLWFAQKTPWLRIGNNKHMIYCRMCFGLWSACLVCIIMADPYNILPAYGASYFLATQERK